MGGRRKTADQQIKYKAYKSTVWVSYCCIYTWNHTKNAPMLSKFETKDGNIGAFLNDIITKKY